MNKKSKYKKHINSIRSGLLVALLIYGVGYGCGDENSKPVFDDKGVEENLDDINNKIYGGVPTNYYITTLEYSTRENGKCTATLLDPRTVLTAGHCVSSSGESTIKLSGGNLGSVKIRFGDGQVADTIPIISAILQPEWADTQNHMLSEGTYVHNDAAYGHDLAILQLAYAPGVTPTTKIYPFLETPIGTELRIVGFGLTAAGAGDSGIKRTAINTVTGFDDNSNRIFYGDTTSGVCSGDSGGPVFAKGTAIGDDYYQIAVNSVTFSPACTYSSAGMHLAKHEIWLRENLSSTLFTQPPLTKIATLMAIFI
jgi:hypothetical protein